MYSDFARGRHKNTDGFHSSSSSDISLTDSFIHTGDDCIAAKSERQPAAWTFSIPSRNKYPGQECHRRRLPWSGYRLGGVNGRTSKRHILEWADPRCRWSPVLWGDQVQAAMWPRRLRAYVTTLLMYCFRTLLRMPWPLALHCPTRPSGAMYLVSERGGWWCCRCGL